MDALYQTLSRFSMTLSSVSHISSWRLSRICARSWSKGILVIVHGTGTHRNGCCLLAARLPVNGTTPVCKLDGISVSVTRPLTLYPPMHTCDVTAGDHGGNCAMRDAVTQRRRLWLRGRLVSGRCLPRHGYGCHEKLADVCLCINGGSHEHL